MRKRYLISALYIVASCNHPAQEQEESSFYIREASAAKTTIKNGAENSVRETSLEGFNEFLGGNFVPAISRILQIDGDFKAEVDSTYARISKTNSSDRFIPCSALSGDSLLCSPSGMWPQFGTDTLVAYSGNGGYSMFYYGLKVVAAGQSISHFGYKDLPELRNAAKTIPTLDSLVFYKIEIVYGK